MTAIDVARKFVGKRESAGHNRADWIDAINREVGIPLGSPYCAAGVSHCFHECRDQRAFDLERIERFPRSGGSQAIRASLAAMGRLSFDPQFLMGMHGAIGGWTNEDDSRHGHVFLITSRFTSPKGLVEAIGTIEFNTDGSRADRDGDGCYELRRVLLANGKFQARDTNTGKLIGAQHVLWFGNTTYMPGGAWWK